jgi:D-3-phosphoglycerate dehydrogenase
MSRHTYPRERLPVLLLENIHPQAAERFREEGYPVEALAGALDETALSERLAHGVAVLGVRSKTPVTARVLAEAPRLLAVAAFCIGTDRIDGAAAAMGGRPVFNAPYSNTRSVVELAIAEIIALNRRLFDRSRDLHAGRWTKSAEGAAEVRGKKLGIVGYGAIGSQLSVLAEALGMEVHYFDTAEKLALGNARKRRSLHELLAAVDVVSLHVDGRAENRDLIGAAEFAAMRDGALLLNLSRGHVVDHAALAAAIGSGKLAGAGIDVFPEEPDSNGEAFDTVLRGLPNLILTPHIGGSTAEAQGAIADFAADRLLGFLHRGDTGFAVNMPQVELPEVRGAHRLLHVHENRPGLLAAVNGVLAERGANILAQYLRTDERVGYVVTDVDRDHAPDLIAALRAVPGTLRFRSVY